jgi:hypothetical protein
LRLSHLVEHIPKCLPASAPRSVELRVGKLVRVASCFAWTAKSDRFAWRDFDAFEFSKLNQREIDFLTSVLEVFEERQSAVRGRLVEVARARFFTSSPETLKQVGSRLGVSAARAQQLQWLAMRGISQYLRGDMLSVESRSGKSFTYGAC